MSRVSGSCSIGPAAALAARNTSTMPPFTTNISTDPPNRTRLKARMNATSATGSDHRVLVMVVNMSRKLPSSSCARSPPSSTATRIAAPMIGTASSPWNVVETMNWIATTGQFAAASNAPRFSRCFKCTSCQCSIRVHSLLRIARAGTAAAVAVALIGWGAERARFGATDASAVSRVQDELRDELDARAGRLGALARRMAVTADQLRAAPHDPQLARTLFDRAASALAVEETGRTGITVYGADGAPIAWAGRVFDLPKERLDGPASLFVAPGAIGPRLVRLEPIVDRAAPSGRAATPRAGTVVVEH